MVGKGLQGSHHRGRRLRRALATAFVLCCAGWVSAQLTHHDLPVLPLSAHRLGGPAGITEPTEFVLARMAYSDLYAGEPLEVRPWQIDAPAAERHFLQGLRRLSAIHARPTEFYVHPNAPGLFDLPFLYVVEPGHWNLTETEVGRIREYLLRGGFIMFDDFHGSAEWQNFMRGIRRIFPNREVEDIDSGSEVFHVLFDMEHREQIPGLQMLYSGRPFEKDGYIPHWRGVRDDDGRLMILINHNMDLGDAWEHADVPEYPERFTAMSYRLAINYIIYAMTH